MIGKSCLFTLTLTALVAFAGPVGAAVITVDDSTGPGTPGNNTTLFSYTGTPNTSKTSVQALCNSNALLVNGTGASETWKVGLAGGFTAGTYYVYGSWYGSTGMTASAQYTVNAADGAHVSSTLNMTKGAAQGQAGSLTMPDSNGDGYYYIGTFSLNASSTVVLNSLTTSYIGGDSIHLRSVDAGFLIDQSTALVTSPDKTKWAYQFQPYSAAPIGQPPSMGYASTSSSATAPGTLVYNIGQALTGNCDVKVSWATASDDRNAKFTIDLNGDGLNTTSFVIDETKFASGAAGTGNPTWSDFKDLGNFNLNSLSTLTVTQDSSNPVGKITAAPVLVTSIAVPEPATMTLLALGATGLFLMPRRK